MYSADQLPPSVPPSPVLPTVFHNPLSRKSDPRPPRVSPLDGIDGKAAVKQVDRSRPRLSLQAQHPDVFPDSPPSSPPKRRVARPGGSLAASSQPITMPRPLARLSSASSAARGYSPRPGRSLAPSSRRERPPPPAWAGAVRLLPHATPGLFKWACLTALVGVSVTFSLSWVGSSVKVLV